MSTEESLQPTLELLCFKVAQAQHAYVLAVLDLFRQTTEMHREMAIHDLTRLMDAHLNRGVSLETVSDLWAITELVKTHGWQLFKSIDEGKVTESIVRLRETFGLTLGGAATLFYTRSTIEPVRHMLDI
jgi:hypothetical protein